jgi:integrase
MPRRRSKHFDLPPHMQRKRFAYYYVARGKWTPLGSDRNKALLAWAQLEQTEPDESLTTLAVVVERYRKDELPKKAPRTQDEYERALKELLPVFGKVKLEAIQPKHVRAYLDRRSRKISGNREIAVLSALFNRAREWGYTRAANPCAGVRRNEERGRDKYVTDEEYRRLYVAADLVLRDAMALAYYTGQRVSDVLKIRRADLRDGALWIRQGKTSANLRIAVEGELRRTIERITERGIVGLYLLTSERGERLTYHALQGRFRKARTAAGVDFQFRDLRAKAATDLENLELAQKLLGHSGRQMTEHYTKKRAGERVKPLDRKILPEEE